MPTWQINYCNNDLAVINVIRNDHPSWELKHVLGQAHMTLKISRYRQHQEAIQGI